MCALNLESKLNSPFVKRANVALLDIQLENGGTRTFSNDGENSYQAVEVVLSSQYIVLNVQHAEGSSFGLLDRKNNQYYQLKGYPAFSPDGKWLVVTNADLAAGYSPNTFQIYGVRNSSIDLIYDARLKGDWAPQRVAWSSSTLISYTHATVGCWEFRRAPCKLASIKYEDGHWR